MPDTLPPQAAQAANAIRDAWLKCDCCDGYGYFSDGHPNDPDSGSYPCSACGGEGVRPGGVQDWRDALELWTFTDGDEDAKAEALAERYDDELIDAIRRAGEAYFQASPELQALARALS